MTAFEATGYVVSWVTIGGCGYMLVRSWVRALKGSGREPNGVSEGDADRQRVHDRLPVGAPRCVPSRPEVSAEFSAALHAGWSDDEVARTLAEIEAL